MAIVSISRLQHRRGVRADLPPDLYEAELGWCLDTRQLFIGNGNTWTGNSQILTQWSPNDQLITHTYIGYTGVTANTAVTGSPTFRTLGSILDDTLCVKDYGAVGDGIADDTAAIQAAIADEWARISNDPAGLYQSRNSIYFPAGTYMVSQSILLYPYITLIGEGVNRTAITLMSGSLGPVLRTADSLGQYGPDIGTDSGILPTSISVKYMNVDGSADPTNPVVWLQRCSGITLGSLKIMGNWLPETTEVPTSIGVRIDSLGTATVTSDIYMSGVSVRNCSTGVYCSDPVIRVGMDQCQIYNGYVGVRLYEGLSGGPSNWRVTNSTMRNLDSYGMEVYSSGQGITSLNNIYNDVGTFYGLPSIYWDASTSVCTSIGDVFSNSDVDLEVSNDNASENVVLNPQRLSITRNQPYTISCVLLPNLIHANLENSWTFDPSWDMLTIFLDYSVVMDTYRRCGRMQIITDGITCESTDSFTELNSDVSLTLGAEIVGDQIIIWYDSTGTNQGDFRYIETTWHT